MFFEDDHHQAWLVFDGCLRLTCPTYTVTPNHSYIQQCSGKLVYINVNTNLDPEFEIKWRKKKHTPSSLSSTFESFFIVLLRRNPSLLSREHNTVMKNLEKGSHSTSYWAKVNWLHFFSFFFWKNWNKTFSVYFHPCIHQGIYLSCCCSDWSSEL